MILREIIYCSCLRRIKKQVFKPELSKKFIPPVHLFVSSLHCLQCFRRQFTEETTVISGKLAHVPETPTVRDFVD